MEELKNICRERELQGILITDPYNLRYLTGFCGGEGVALYTESMAVLYVDSRYTKAAEEECLVKGNGFRVKEFNRREPLMELLKGQLVKDEAERIGFEDRVMVCSTFSRYTAELGVRLLPLEGSLDCLRRLKTPEELKLLCKAEEIGDTALSHVLGLLKPGMTELSVAAELEYAMKKAGAEGLSFDTIAASGPNSAKPHAIPSDRRLAEGDFLTMDFGCIYHGYCSDMTRTVVIGKASPDQRKVYQTVLDAHLKAMEGLRPGMRCCDVDKIARDHIEAAGYGEYFGHGLGHSVGLYIHEGPALNTRDETLLVPGMIETIEPGIYIPGFGGVRIEDMGVVTEEGYTSFAHSPKELIEL